MQCTYNNKLTACPYLKIRIASYILLLLVMGITLILNINTLEHSTQLYLIKCQERKGRPQHLIHYSGDSALPTKSRSHQAALKRLNLISISYRECRAQEAKRSVASSSALKLEEMSRDLRHSIHINTVLRVENTQEGGNFFGINCNKW